MSDVRRAAIASLAGYAYAPMPSRRALERIWQEVALARDDASCLRFHDREIRRYRSNRGGFSNPWPDNTKRRWPSPARQNAAGAPARQDGTARSPAVNCADRERKNPPQSIRFKAPKRVTYCRA